MASEATRGEEGTAWLSVVAAGESLAVTAVHVTEVARLPACTRVPNGPACLLGLCNLRGSVLPVVSLAALLGRADAGPTADAAGSRLVVLAGAAPVGVVVDGIAALGARNGGRALDLPALVQDAFGTASGQAVRRAEAGQATAPAVQDRAQAAPRDVLVLVVLVVAGQDYALPLGSVVEVTRVPE